MRTDETDLQQVLRRAMGRAGLVRGFLHVCRRKGCGHEEQAEDAELRKCPNCKMKLWPRRCRARCASTICAATTATLLARAGVPLVVAQRMLRHADPRLTANVYTRVDLADLRAEVARLPPLVPTVSPRADSQKTRAASSRETRAISRPWIGRGDRIEPATPWSRTGTNGIPSVSSAGTAPQPPEITSDAEPAGSDARAESGYVETPFGAPWCASCRRILVRTNFS